MFLDGNGQIKDEGCVLLCLEVMGGWDGVGMEGERARERERDGYKMFWVGVEEGRNEFCGCHVSR